MVNPGDMRLLSMNMRGTCTVSNHQPALDDGERGFFVNDCIRDRGCVAKLRERQTERVTNRVRDRQRGKNSFKLSFDPHYVDGAQQLVQERERGWI